MRLPRDVSGADLSRALRRYEYVVVRQSGSHIRLATTRNGEHHITVPNHSSLKIGTLNSILRDVANHLDIDRDTLIETLFR